MKRKLFSIFTILFILSGCTKTISYTDEFPYLPQFPNMKVVEITEEDKESKLRSATYIVKNSNIEAVMEEYERLLLRDNWVVTFDNKPAALEVSKDEHLAYIFAYQKDTDVHLAITAK